MPKKNVIEERLYLAYNVAFVLGYLSIDELIAKLKAQKEPEYESTVSSIGIASDKLRFRG